MKDYHGKCHTKECKDNLLIINYNQTLKTFNTLIQCMFSEYSGSLNGRNAYDNGFSIAIQAKRYLQGIFWYKYVLFIEECNNKNGNNSVLFCTIYADDLDFIDVKYNYKR